MEPSGDRTRAISFRLRRQAAQGLRAGPAGGRLNRTEIDQRRRQMSAARRGVPAATPPLDMLRVHSDASNSHGLDPGRRGVRRLPARPCFRSPAACYRPVIREFSPSHGVFRVKLIRLHRPLACHPRSGAKRSGAGSEATLTRQRPDTLSRASAPLRALGCLCGLCRAHSFWHCASPLAFGSEA